MFKGIEGARAWLAWTVVLHHILYFGGFSVLVSRFNDFPNMGDLAVKVFIIISGFVITNLLLSKHEGYFLYLKRRALRIFPAYLICLAFAVWVAPLSYSLIHYPYTNPVQVELLTTQSQQFHTNFMTHLLAHISLLHGAISNNILPQSEYMFLSPAWSLSLEWQFYLIAPLWLWCLRKSPWLGAGLPLLVFHEYPRFLGGSFALPSFLPGAILWFLVGICTRLYIQKLPRLQRYPWIPVLVGFGMISLGRVYIPFALWIALVAYIQHEKSSSLLDGKFAQAAGARSFSVYMAHLPILFAAAYLAVSVLHLNPWQALAFIAVLTLIGTALASELLYRFIEKPGIDYARRLSRDQKLKEAQAA